MKRYIKNKVYDTDTARFIGRIGYSNPGDLNYWSDNLYQKKTGEFFMFCEGGAMSKYSKQTGDNEWSGDWTIKPVNYDEAEKWAQINLDADTYEKYFVAQTDDDGKVQMGINVSKANAERLRKNSAKLGMGVSQYIESLIPKD